MNRRVALACMLGLPMAVAPRPRPPALPAVRKWYGDPVTRRYWIQRKQAQVLQDVVPAYGGHKSMWPTKGRWHQESLL